MSDGSFPHKNPEPDEAPPQEESVGGRVIDFPADDAARPFSEPVPAGTWADDSRVDGEVAGGEVVEFPRSPSTERRRKRPAPDDVEASGIEVKEERISAVEETAPVRPKYIASELLRQDWYPETPLLRTLKWGSIGLGATGVLAVIGVGGLAIEALGLAALFALCAVTGLAPLTAQARGAALAAVGAVGAVWVGWLHALEMEGLTTPLLIACVTLTASALFFRASHRISKLARALVGVGVMGVGVWLVLSGGLEGFVVETLAWQSWVGPASHLLLAFIALGAVLSFLDPTGHGGAWVAGFALLAWLGLDAAGAFAVAVFPLDGRASADLSGPGWLALAALPIFAAVAAGGFCQVFAGISRRLQGKSPRLV